MSDSHNTIAAAPESQSPAISPRYHVPDDWSGKGACPVCRTPGQLRVQHQDVAPDRIVCGACGAAFEVASAGARIRLAVVPPALAANTAELVDVWLMPAELLALVEGAISAETNVAAGSLTAAPLVPKPANGHSLEPDAQPGGEDRFAPLAAAIGGLLPARPPPNSVLADELERALTSRPLPSPNIAAELAPTAMAAAASDVAALVAPGAAGATSTPLAAAETVDAGAGTLADPSADLIGQAASSIPPATAMPEVPAPHLAPPTVMAASSPSAAAHAAPPGAEATVLLPAGRAAVNAVTPAAEVSLSTPARASAASRREWAERAWKLHELGNSLPSIQSALERSGGEPADVEIIMAKLIALEQARQARFRRNVQWAAGGAILGLVILLAIAALISNLAAR